jgi:anhydro-N-acetylmuramic acid kinase
MAASSDGPAVGGSLAYVGLMCGTSQDGIDAVVLTIDGPALHVAAHRHTAFDGALRAHLQALNAIGADELHRACEAAERWAELAAATVAALLADARLPARRVRAVGSHGITLRHRPPVGPGARGYTLQIDNPALLAELTGIHVVADFRRRDMAAGGQGAPLVPAFHAAVFATPGQTRAVLNLGGFANLTVLGVDGGVEGFDCGPANVLLDGWAQQHLGMPFDHDGAWAASGQPLDRLLAMLLADPFFAQPPPKSTGRDVFHAGWLAARLEQAGCEMARPADIAATLVELTAALVACDLRRHARDAADLLVCGGGTANGHLMRRLAARVAPVPVNSTARAGIDPQHVEAAAFAWLAHAHLERLAGNRPEVTGAVGPRVLGAFYPAA